MKLSYHAVENDRPVLSTHLMVAFVFAGQQRSTRAAKHPGFA